MRVAKTLKNYGERVQLSVFEVLAEPQDVEQLIARISDMLNNDVDSLRVYPLCATCQDRIQVIGQGKVTQDPDFKII